MNRALVMVVVVLAVGGQRARAEFIYLTQSRTLTVNCSVTQSSGPPIGNSDSAQAPDFAPWTDSLSVSTLGNNPAIFASATASQSSILAASEIIATGIGAASPSGNGILSGGGDSGASFTTTFMYHGSGSARLILTIAAKPQLPTRFDSLDFVSPSAGVQFTGSDGTNYQTNNAFISGGGALSNIKLFPLVDGATYTLSAGAGGTVSGLAPTFTASYNIELLEMLIPEPPALALALAGLLVAMMTRAIAR
jgi:hypothetical protein